MITQPNHSTMKNNKTNRNHVDGVDECNAWSHCLRFELRIRTNKAS